MLGGLLKNAGAVLIRLGTALSRGIKGTNDGLFRVGAEEWSPEHLGFGSAVNGRASRMKFSGVEFYRTLTP